MTAKTETAQDRGVCTWSAYAPRYLDERDCLSAFIALEAAEVLSGVKPANLIRLSSRTQPCGRKMSELWRLYGRDVLLQAELSAVVLRKEDGALLILLFSRELLARRLNSRSARALLRKIGYITTGRWQDDLDQLEKRFASASFPHEVGIFLGYPLKDVRAFLGLSRLPATGQCLWKIYGHRWRSERLAGIYRSRRDCVANRLAAGEDPHRILTDKTVL